MELPKRPKRNELWDYFEELERLLAKCKICGEEIRSSCRQYVVPNLRKHLLQIHDMFYDKYHIIPDQLRKYYSDLPKYKAKCNKCGKIISYLTNSKSLKRHLQITHNTIIQSQHKTDTIKLPKRAKHNKLWDYFEPLEHLLAKCRICGDGIRVSYKNNMIRALRVHLSKHQMFADKYYTIPDQLRQYYSDLPKYKAKCNKCGRIISYLMTYMPLKRHLKIHPNLMNQSQHEQSTLSSKGYVMDPSTERQSQEPQDLFVKLRKQTRNKKSALYEPSLSSSTSYHMDLSAERQSKTSPALPILSSVQKKKETAAIYEVVERILKSVEEKLIIDSQTQE